MPEVGLSVSRISSSREVSVNETLIFGGNFKLKFAPTPRTTDITLLGSLDAFIDSRAEGHGLHSNWEYEFDREIRAKQCEHEE